MQGKSWTHAWHSVWSEGLLHAGNPHHGGSYVLRDHYPTDCTIVRKLKEAGGILVSKTNLLNFLSAA
jgi:Asp-tRNA(Asn)/Glu-tRNA(Gln) amidotransferase A subunit family amidase